MIVLIRWMFKLLFLIHWQSNPAYFRFILAYRLNSELTNNNCVQYCPWQFTCVHAYECVLCVYVCVCVWGGGGGERKVCACDRFFLVCVCNLCIHCLDLMLLYKRCLYIIYIIIYILQSILVFWYLLKEWLFYYNTCWMFSVMGEPEE